LYKHIILFLLPVMILILILPVNKRLKYQGLENDCFNHAIWIYDRIYNNSKPMDIVFLGSSRTINGINDKLIEQELKEYNMAVVNFGYCRLGRNLSYALLKEIVSRKKPEYLIIEVSRGEDRYSHPIFPHIANTIDVIFANPFFNRDLLTDILTHFSYKIELWQDMIFQKTVTVPIRTSDFGFASSIDTIAGEILQEAKIGRSIPRPEMKKIEQNFYMSFPRIYLKKLHRICQENNINMLFLYIPPFGTDQFLPDEYKTYIKYGIVMLPPVPIMDNPSNWHDADHLNQTGANKLSLYVTSEIKKLLSDSTLQRK